MHAQDTRHGRAGAAGRTAAFVLVGIVVDRFLAGFQIMRAGFKICHNHFGLLFVHALDCGLQILGHAPQQAVAFLFLLHGRSHFQRFLFVFHLRLLPIVLFYPAGAGDNVVLPAFPAQLDV